MRNWKIGTITAGVLLITIGLLWILSNAIDLSMVKVISIGWPVLLIMLGLEILLHQLFRRETPLKFDGFSIFLVFAVGIISIALYSFQSISIFSPFSKTFLNNAEEFEISDSIPLTDEINEIVIDIPNGDVIIEGKDTKELTYDGAAFVGADSRKKAEEILKDAITWRVEGEKLILEMKSRHAHSIFNWNAFHVEVAMTVPEDRYVVTDMKNGKLNVTNLQGGADLALVNGKLDAADIKNVLKAKSSNGNITLESIFGTVNATNTNGNIQVSELDGPISAKTTNGSIKMEDIKLSNSSSLSTTNGEIIVSLAETTDLAITAKTTNGGIKGDLDWKRSGAKNATYGQGTTVLEITTTNGSITVDNN